MATSLKMVFGFYSQSFMNLWVDVPNPLDDVKNLGDVHAESLYLHEMVHFVQDIATTYGLSNINVVADYMRFANNAVVDGGPGPFSVPVLSKPGDPFNVYGNKALNEYGFGTGEETKVKLLDVIQRTEWVDIGSDIRPLPLIGVKYMRRPDRSIGNFDFGALCILESMAHLMQKQCYPGSRDLDDLPYNSAYLLARKVAPFFDANKLNLIALCDAALQDFNPGWYFHLVLTEIENQKKVFSAPEEVYDFARSVHPDFRFHHISNDLTALFLFISAQARDQLGKYFNDSAFDFIKNWLQSMISRARDFRMNHPTFPLDMAKAGTLKSNAPFDNFVQKVGTPLLRNNRNDIYLLDPSSPTTPANYSLIWAIEEIQELFLENKFSCDMINHCQKSGIATDGRCLTAPWERAFDKNPCPFGQMWHHWALKGHIPTQAVP